MSTDQQIAEFLAKGGKITKCPPVLAQGSEAKQGLRKHVAAERRKFRAIQKNPSAYNEAGERVDV